MGKEDFVSLFKKDFQYYDQEQKEFRAVTSLITLNRNKRLLDIGAGIGRFAIPLSKYIRVTAIDINEHLLKEIKNKNIERVKEDIKNYRPGEKFDYVLIVWPQFENYDEVFKNIKENILKRNGKLIVLKSSEHSLRKITKIFFPELFNSKNPKFLKILQKHFKIEEQNMIETQWIFPNTQTAFNLLLFEIAIFYKRKLNEEQKQILRNFIQKHERGEEVYLKAKVRVLSCA